MVDTKLSDAVRLIDVDEVKKIIALSKPTIWRHHESGIMPPGLKIGRSVRWILRSGDPRTGICDWLEAGCPHCGPATETTGGDSQ